MTRRHLRFAVAVFALAGIASVVGAAPRPDGKDSDRHEGERGERLAERHAERLTRALDLTEEQQTRLAALQDELGETLRPSLEAMRSMRDELEAELESANPDPAAVGSRAIALHRTKESMKRAHETFETGLKAMLTEGQRVRYEAMRDAREERDGRFGHGRRHGTLRD